MSDTLKVLLDSIHRLQSRISQMQTVSNNTSASWEFLKTSMANGLGSIIGGFIGVGGSLWLYNKQSKKQKAEEVKIYKQQQEEKLIYFSMLLEKIANVINTMQENIKQSINLIDIDNTNFYALTVVPLEDLDRVSNKLNLEEYLLVYIKHSKSNDSIKNFQNIISLVDSTYHLLLNLEKTTEKAGRVNFEEGQKVANISSKLRDLIRPLSVGRTTLPTDTVLELHKIFGDHFSNSKGELKDVKNHFFAPINNLILTLMHSSSLITTEMEILAVTSLDGMEAFSSLEREMDEYKQLLNFDLNQLKEWQNEFIELLKTLP